MKKFKVTVDGQPYTVLVEEIEQKKAFPAAGSVVNDKKPPALPQEKPIAPEPERAAPKARPEEPASPAGAGVPAPMPGSIIEVRVREGDSVKAGEVLVILEAMKMENEVTAQQSGTVKQVLVKKGDTVNSGDPLVIIS